MQLSARLEKLIEMAGQGCCAADIGTDHGYIPIELVRRGHYTKALAMDVRKGPLERAQEHVRMAGLQGKIETRLSDGMEKMSPGEADTIIIAGMGGHLMADILTRGMQVVEKAERAILSPHYDVEFFHQYLLENAFKVEDESWIFDENKFYVVIRCRKCSAGEEVENWSAVELRYGRIPLQEKQACLKMLAEKELATQEKLLEKLQGTQGERAQAKLGEVKAECELIREALKILKEDN